MLTNEEKTVFTGCRTCSGFSTNERASQAFKAPLRRWFVFFAERSDGPMGCLGVPVTAKCSLALDRELFPPGALCFLDIDYRQNKNKKKPRHFLIKKFALNQDTGGVIKGPGRCDIFWGVGKEAGKEAHLTYALGDLYFIFLK